MSAHACNQCSAEPHTEHARGCPYHPLNLEAARAVGDASHDDGKRMYAEPAHLSPDEAFVRMVLAEVRGARAKFGNNGSYIQGLALGEEAGEAQRALLHIHEGKGGESDLYLECVQTAAMALRLAVELEDRKTWPGNSR